MSRVGTKYIDCNNKVLTILEICNTRLMDGGLIILYSYDNQPDWVNTEFIDNWKFEKEYDWKIYDAERIGLEWERELKVVNNKYEKMIRKEINEDD